MRKIKLFKRDRRKQLTQCDASCRAAEARARFDREYLPLGPRF